MTPSLTATGEAKDPVCRMTVDPATTPHRHTHGGDTYFFCSGGCRAKFAANPKRYLSRLPAAAARAGRHDLHLPDASRRCGRTVRAPARSAAWRSNPMMPTAETGPNPELADMTRRFWIGLALTVPVLALEMGGHLRPAHAARASSFRTGSSSSWRRRWCCGPAGRSSCAAGHSLVNPQPQHVHADRDRHRRGVALQRRRDGCARAVSAGVPRPRTARSRSISRPPPSSPCWCCSARCWSCAPASRPRAPSARCSISRRRPRRRDRGRRRRRGVPLDAVAGRRSPARAARREGAGRRRS